MSKNFELETLNKFCVENTQYTLKTHNFSDEAVTYQLIKNNQYLSELDTQKLFKLANLLCCCEYLILAMSREKIAFSMHFRNSL